MFRSTHSKPIVVSWIRQSVPGRCGFAILAAVTLAGAVPRDASALDSGRRLTQALHRIWQAQQGLPQATIDRVIQSNDGYLWLGTQSGLVRFDGVRFVPIDSVNGTKPEGVWVRDLAEDPVSHDLWIATNSSGLLRLRDGQVTRNGMSNGLPSDNVQCVLFDSRDALWIGTSEGLAIMTDGRFRPCPTALALASPNIRAICQGRDGSIWVGGDGNMLGIWNGTSLERRELKSISAQESVHALIAQPDGTIWIGSSAGLIRLTNGEEKRFTTAEGLGSNWVYGLAAGRDGDIWVGTQDGFSRLRNDQIGTFRSRDGLSQSTVFTVCEDREGSLWVGTKHGLNQFVDRRLTLPFTASEGLPSNNTGPVIQDSAGTVWVGTLDAGLSRFDGHAFSVLTPDQGLADNSILSMAADAGGNLWIGTRTGLNRLANGRVVQTLSKADGLPADSVGCLLMSRSGDLWAGTTSGPAILHDGHFKSPAGAALKGAVRAMTELRDGRVLLAAAGGGLYACINGVLGPLDGIYPPTRDIDAFYEDADGLLWIGMIGGGLRMLDGQHVHTFAPRDGLFDDEIFGIAADNQDRLWMACSKGIFYVNRADLRKFAGGQIKSFSSTPFTPTDAQRTIECRSGVQPSTWGMRDGTLWFSTIHGVLVIEPSHLLRKLPAPPVVVEEVVVNGKTEDPDRVRSLPPGRENLEFRYTGLSFLIPTRITFRYKLEGFDREWILAGARREAFYTNLPPGNFKFHVEAANLDGQFTPNQAVVAFTLLPHFYQRHWFVPACLTLAAVGIWIVIRMRIRRIKSQMVLILAERSRIARELHDTLIQGFSGVTMEMQALSAQLPDASPRGVLQEIIRDAGHCLREARRSVAGLRSGGTGRGATDLSASIAQAARQLTEARDVRLRLDLTDSPGEVGADAEYNLLRIMSEAVANAVKHGAPRSIEISLERTRDQLRLAIRDDGSGFDASHGNGAVTGHYGLIGMKERAAQLGGNLSVESAPGKGTTIVAIVPAGASNEYPVVENRGA